MSYASRSRELDAEILRVIGTWSRDRRAPSDAEFDDLALRLFAYQLEYNAPYARYCASLGFSLDALPDSWEAIAPVPSGAYKEATLATFDPSRAALAFRTSGTTTGVGGRHFMETRALYDAALLAGFDRFLLTDGAALRYLNLVPNPAERPDSSLGYMMQQVALHRGDAQTGWYLRGNDLLLDAFIADAEAAIGDGAPVCVAATAFALAHLLDALEARAVRLALPAGSRVMETGGFKGRARAVDRDELYRRTAEALGIPIARIVAEYGMTELTSQYYDDVLAAPPGDPSAPRLKRSPPWLRARVVGPDGATLPDATVGTLVHVDLANRSSCVAVATEDLGARFGDAIVLIGRERGAALRGCSLDAETLRSAKD